MVIEQNEAVRAVRRMQDYIDSHITEPITLLQLAKAAGYSPWHSARIFREYTGKTPFDYIRALRLSKAALVLRDKKAKIIDVAFDFDFDSHEGFTKAFSKQFGISPKRCSKTSPPIPLFIPYAASDLHRSHSKGGDSMCDEKRIVPVFIQVIERPERKVMLLRGKKATDYFECQVLKRLCMSRLACGFRKR